MDWQDIFDFQPPEEEFPNEYSIKEEIKSPLNVLYYNMNFEFLDNYPAKMSQDYARDMIKIYSRKGDIVWDPCCGSGVVPREATRLGRFSLGTDINPKAIELCKKHQQEVRTKDDQYYVSDAKTHEIGRGNSIDLILTSFPFGLNIIGDKNRYSVEVEDLSNSKNFETFSLE